MADTWFRMYNTAVDHPKVMMLPDAQFRAWVQLMCLASKLGGIIPPDLPLIAATLRKTVAKAEALIQALEQAVLLDPLEGGGWVPHNWNEKQFKSDVSTERVKRFRERSRNVSETDHRQKQRQKQKEKTDARLARFDEFWAVCPKKTGRGAAEKAWPRAVELAGDPEILIAGMQAYAGTCGGKDQAYIKTPGPWLNEKRWLDEAVKPQLSLVFEPADERGWEERLRIWRERQSWLAKWGPDPSKDDCKCPPDILRRGRAA